MTNMHRITDVLGFKSSQIAATSTGDGTAIDALSYEDVAFVIHGVTAGASTIDAKVRECATSGGSYVDVASAAIVQIPASQTSKVSIINVKTSHRLRFLKCNVTIAGTATADVVAVLGNGRWKAITQDTTAISV